jgi:hypothetical protein
MFLAKEITREPNCIEEHPSNSEPTSNDYVVGETPQSIFLSIIFRLPMQIGI